MAPEDETGSPVRDLLLDDAGGGGKAAELLNEEERKRRRRKLMKLAAIAAALIAIAIILILRAVTGSQPLPGIPSTLPHHVSDIYGSSQPMGVAVNPSGNRVYVTESAGRRLVRVYDGSGNQIDTLKPPARAGKGRLPVYVAVNPKTEDVYVSDRLREVIDVYNPNGKYRRSLHPSGRLGKGANPLGLAFGPEGDLYATNVRGEKKSQDVLVFGGQGSKPLRKIGSRGAFWFPNGLVLDAKRDLYVADSDNGRLEIFNPEGKLASSIARGVGEGDLGLPRGVAISGERLFIVDTTAHTVKVYRLPGKVSEVPRYVGSFGVEGIGNGQFQYPNGIAIDGNGRIYVTDRENDRVQVWSY